MSNRNIIDEMTSDFLEKGQKVLLHDLYCAIGEGEKSPLNGINTLTSNHSRIVTDLMEIIKAQTMKGNIEAESTNDVIKLLKSGKINIDEAFKLMAMKRLQFEIEVLPQMMIDIDE